MGKICKKCGEYKEFSEFYKHSKMKDGYLNQCISCKILYTVEYQKANIDSIREYDRIRGRSKKRKEKYREYIRKLKETDPERYKNMKLIAIRNYRNKFKEKNNARARLNYAIRTGKIKAPEYCELCGKNTRLEAHHSDYSDPLAIQWLCDSCHKKTHIKMREAMRKIS